MDTGAKTVSGPAIVTTVNHGRGPLAKIAPSIRAPVPVEGVVMRLLTEWTAADKLIAAAVALREQAGARAN